MVGYDWELSALHAILRGISSLTGTVQFSRLVSSFDAAQDSLRHAQTFRFPRASDTGHLLISTILKTVRHKRTVFKIVEMGGETLNRLKEYLARFWEYYESSPGLQKALCAI